MLEIKLNFFNAPSFFHFVLLSFLRCKSISLVAWNALKVAFLGQVTKYLGHVNKKTVILLSRMTVN